MSEILSFPVPASRGDAERTVAEVIQLYLRHTKHEMAPRTFADRKAVLEQFEAAHGGQPLAACKPYHLRLWVDAHESWASDWTKKRVIGTVQRCFNWAVKLGIADRNPFAGVSNPAGERGQPMGDADFAKMLRRSSAVFRRVLVFLRFTGCRPGEMSALRPEDLDLERGLAVLAQHKTKKKTRKPRVIVLPPPAVKLLRWQLARMRPGQKTLFVSARGNPWHRSSLALRMGRLRKACGIAKSVKLYGLRHGYGTQAILRGVPLKTVSELMGHASTAMTEHYVHLAGQTQHLMDAVAKIFRPEGT